MSEALDPSKFTALGPSITYAVRIEDVYIGYGRSSAELHHLGVHGFELEWLVLNRAGVPEARQTKAFATRAEAEAFVREHALSLFINDRIAGIPLRPPTYELLDRRCGESASVLDDAEVEAPALSPEC